ncbi:hypothetical protein JDY09_03255 [Thermoleophilum album]|uniref:methionyl-tRNA formyltransferase n=1 Tax=Thermoleophilum album TaxID=29539 RepID=UPI00237CD5AB|nr:formyltransferase family protein [Thermoleophilum album]WDT94284.1 hypothetical protein JDY09_03255 [Thermoleophilum album]
MARPLRVALIAEEATGARVLRSLLDRGVEPVLVLTDSVRAHTARGGPVAEAARSAGLSVEPAARVRDPAFAARLADSADLVLNVHALHVLPPAVVAAPRIGALNLHPGPLPELAGLNAPSWAIYLGEREHGVTLHWMSAEIDAGPIAYCERFTLTGRERAFQLAATCARLGVALVERAVDEFLAGREPPRRPQDLSRRRLFPAGPPCNGRLEWSRPVRELEALVRACDYGPFPSPWGEPWILRSDGLTLSVTHAEIVGGSASHPAGTVIAAHGRRAVVAAADGLLAVRLAAPSAAGDDGRSSTRSLLVPGERLPV